MLYSINPLSTNFTKWSNTLKQFVGKLPTNFLSVFDHFVGLALKGLIDQILLYDCLYFLRYCPICALQLFVNLFVTS